VSARKNQTSDSLKSSSFGVWIGRQNRERYFSKDWSKVAVELPSGVVLDVAVLPGFWNHCPELRDDGFRDWFASQGALKWSHRCPPKYDFVPVGPARFRLSLIA
jgi:hypothetical protein